MQYKWKLEGRTVYVCPNCNRRLENQQSRDAFRKQGQADDKSKAVPVKKSTGCLGCLGFLVVLFCIGGLLSWLRPSQTPEQTPPQAPTVEDRKVNESPASPPLPTSFPYQGRTPTQMTVHIPTGAITVKPGETFTVLRQEGDKVIVRLDRFEFPLPTQNVFAVQR